jgi:eukaryotic-like serine/threonine-protein kinase
MSSEPSHRSQEGQLERTGLWEAGQSLREAFFANAEKATKSAKAALERSHNREVVFGAALALAVSGDSVGAQALATDLEKRFPQDTIVRFHYLPVVRARILLNHGEASKAIEQLQVSAPYELGAPRLLFGALYPIYLRGEAYLDAHQGADAAIEFQKILDHRGIVGSDPIGALAHLQLARAAAFTGDKSKAKTAYQDFFLLWKDADPGIPVLKQARAEYLKLD